MKYASWFSFPTSGLVNIVYKTYISKVSVFIAEAQNWAPNLSPIFF